MTPDQYRREGAEAMQKAAADHCWSKRDLLADAEKRQIDVGLSGRDYYGRRLEAELLSRAIRAIDVDEVLACLRPRCAECDCEDGNCTLIKAGPADECDEGVLPCPFCGGPAEIVEIDKGENAGGSCVCCTRCFASGNVEFGFKENFISNWNHRVQTLAPDAVAQLVEAARAALNYLENTEGEFGITLESATGLRAALAAMETDHDLA